MNVKNIKHQHYEEVVNDNRLPDFIFYLAK